MFEIISGDNRCLEAYVEAYNEIYPKLSEYARSVEHSVWNHSRQDELKYTLQNHVYAAERMCEPWIARALMYHIISDIGLRLQNPTLMYVFIRTLEDMNHV